MEYKDLYTKRAKELERSAIAALKDEAAGIEDMLSLGEGVPAAELFPTQALSHVASKVFAEVGQDVLQYGDTKGWLALRSKIVDIMSKYGVITSPACIQITSGSMQSLDIAARLLLDVGDTVLVEDPTFIDAKNCLAMTGATVKGIPCDSQGMDLGLLKETLETDGSIKAIYVIPDYQNPTGLCWSDERRQAFIDLVNEYNIIILEDNPYGEITYTNTYRRALAAYDKKGQVLFMGSLSKTLSPGLRIGWLSGDETLITNLNLVKECCDIHSSLPDHAIAAEFMNIYSYDDHVASMNTVYKERRNTLVAALQEELPEFTFTVPEGGFFLWLKLPATINEYAFFQAAIKENVLVIPGAPFFVNSPSVGFVRLNFTGLEPEKLQEAVKRLGKAYQSMIK